MSRLNSNTYCITHLNSDKPSALELSRGTSPPATTVHTSLHHIKVRVTFTTRPTFTRLDIHPWVPPLWLQLKVFLRLHLLYIHNLSILARNHRFLEWTGRSPPPQASTAAVAEEIEKSKEVEVDQRAPKIRYQRRWRWTADHKRSKAASKLSPPTAQPTVLSLVASTITAEALVVAAVAATAAIQTVIQVLALCHLLFQFSWALPWLSLLK